MDEFKYGEVCYHRWWGFGAKQLFTYRCGTVPGIRKCRPSRRWYRVPKVIYEPRNAYMADADIRQVLTPHQIAQIEKFRNWLPDPWDDVYDRSKRNHNWKQFRKTRYK